MSEPRVGLAAPSEVAMTLIEYRTLYPDRGPEISLRDLETRCEEYEREEGGYDRYYRPSCGLVGYGIQNERWDCICGGTSLLVYAWNAPFYRAPFDYGRLKASLRNRWQLLTSFRRRPLATFNPDDEAVIEEAFNDLTNVLSSGNRRAQVSAAKALHAIAPDFFPMWDRSIADALYNTPYADEPGVAYLAFCGRIRSRVVSLQPDWDSLDRNHWLRNKPILKRVDEFNFMRRPRRRAQT